MRMGDIADKIISGQIMSRVAAKEESGDKVIETKSVLIPKAISNGSVDHSVLGVVNLRTKVDKDRVTKKGDIVIKLSTPYDSVLVDDSDEDLVVPSFCVLIRGVDDAKADRRFIAAYLNTDHVRQILRAKVAGATMPLVRLRDVRDLELPKVPLKQQRMLGQAYQLSARKQIVMKELLINEQNLMESLVLHAVKESIQ